MAELVDAQDLKSCVKQLTCQFDSGSRQWPPCLRGLFFWRLIWNFIRIRRFVLLNRLMISKINMLLLWDWG